MLKTDKNLCSSLEVQEEKKALKALTDKNAQGKRKAKSTSDDQRLNYKLCQNSVVLPQSFSLQQVH